VSEQEKSFIWKHCYLLTASMLDEWNMCATDKGIIKTSEKILSHCHFVQHKSNVTATVFLDAIQFNIVDKYQRLGGY